MKRRSKEINVFSISALDLFASGMGAFILITIILIPYFPNEAPPAEVLARLTAERDQAQADLQECRNSEEECLQKSQALEAQVADLAEQLDALKNAPKLTFPPLDLVIALDSTGSMQKEVAGIKREIGQLAELLIGLSPDVAIGIIDFKDRCDSSPITAFPLQKIISSNLSSISRFTNRITAGSDACNKDLPEAFDQALSKAVSMPWHRVSKVKVIVLISDNPAYPEFENKVIASARSFASKGAGFHVSTVFVNHGADNTEDHTEQFLKSVAEAGQGEFVGSSGGSFTATILLAIAGI